MTARDPKHVLVTGTSSGFGLLTVLELLRHGHRVLAGLRGGELRAEKILPTLATQDQALLSEARSAGRLTWVDLDVDSPEHRARTLAWIDQYWSGRLDALVNNAGYGLLGPSETQSLTDVRAQFETNFFSAVALSQDLLPKLRQTSGALIQVSSIVGLYSLPFYGPYSATKHALEAVSEAWWHELEPWGVRVHLIEPGGFKTEFASQVKWSAGIRSQAEYAQSIGRFQAAHTRKSKNFGGNPQKVVNRIVQLIEQPSRKLRHLLGADALLLNVLSRLLPDQLRLVLVRLIFRSIFR